MGWGRVSRVLGAGRASASIIGLAMAILSVAGVCWAAQNAAETGSTLFYPLFQAWVGAYAKIDPVAMFFSFLRNNETCAQPLVLLYLLRSLRSLRSG